MGENVLSVLMLYAVKDNNTFVSGANGNRLFYISQAINFIQRVVQYAISNKEKHNTKYAFKLLSGILESSRGKIGDLLPELLNFSITYVEAKKNSQYSEALVELIASFFLYNAELVIQVLTSANKLEIILNFWITNLEKQELHMLINKSIMGLISILCINPANQNEKIKENIKFILEKLLILVKKTKKKTKKEINPDDLLDEEESIEEDDEKDDKFAKLANLDD